MRILLLAAALLGWLAAPASAQHLLEPAHPDLPLRGPGAALGAVIWSHGKAAMADESNTAIQPYLASLRAAGWDVFRLNRTVMSDNQNDSEHEFGHSVDRLKGEGYGRIVLAGQSFGAWISLLLAGERGDLHAVIATAPAAYGTWRSERGGLSHWDLNASHLYDILGRVQPTRVLLFFFANDDFDPGGRGPRAEAILAQRNIPHLIVDRPPGLAGHGAARSAAFRALFGPCIVAFVAPESAPGATLCTPGAGAGQPTGEVRLPEDLRLEPPSPGAPAAIAALSGRWWGWLDNGREVEVVVEKVTPGEATFVYAYGPGDSAGSKPGYVRRTGKIAEGGVTYQGAGNPTLSWHPAGDDRLDLRWDSADGRSHLKATLSRLKEGGGS
jgi:dienelactone hydrolase